MTCGNALELAAVVAPGEAVGIDIEPRQAGRLWAGLHNERPSTDHSGTRYLKRR